MGENLHAVGGLTASGAVERLQEGLEKTEQVSKDKPFSSTFAHLSIECSSPQLHPRTSLAFESTFDKLACSSFLAD